MLGPAYEEKSKDLITPQQHDPGVQILSLYTVEALNIFPKIKKAVGTLKQCNSCTVMRCIKMVPIQIL